MEEIALPSANHNKGEPCFQYNPNLFKKMRVCQSAECINSRMKCPMCREPWPDFSDDHMQHVSPDNQQPNYMGEGKRALMRKKALTAAFAHFDERREPVLQQIVERTNQKMGHLHLMLNQDSDLM